jgi:hypothetical protein
MAMSLKDMITLLQKESDNPEHEPIDHELSSKRNKFADEMLVELLGERKNNSSAKDS